MVHLLKWFNPPCILDSRMKTQKDWACSTFYINFYSISKNKRTKSILKQPCSRLLCVAKAGAGGGGKRSGRVLAAEAGWWGQAGGSFGSTAASGRCSGWWEQLRLLQVVATKACLPRELRGWAELLSQLLALSCRDRAAVAHGTGGVCSGAGTPPETEY